MLPRVMGLHMQLGKATLSGCASVGDGHLIGVASSSLFKRTDSQKRSYINYYFRLLEKTKKEWEGDRVERMCQKHRAAPPALCLTLILSSFSVQIQRQKCLFLSVSVTSRCKNLHINKAKTALASCVAFAWQKTAHSFGFVGQEGFRWHIWNASVMLHWHAARLMPPDKSGPFFIIPPVNVYSSVRGCGAAGEDHAATASVRVIPVIRALLWQQARARERGKIERASLYTFL